MAGSLSDYLEQKLLDHVFGSDDYTPPASLFVALFTVAPTDAGGGTEVNPATSWSNYARQEIVNSISGTTWAAASGTNPTLKTNADIVTWGAASLTGASVSVVAAAIFDALTGGNMLAWGDLTTSPKVVGHGDTPSLAAGEIDITLD